MTLLEKAKNIARRKPNRPRAVLIDEKVEVAIAYANGEISSSQVAASLGLKASTSCTGMLGSYLMAAIRRGDYRLVKVEKGAVDAQD